MIILRRLLFLLLLSLNWHSSSGQNVISFKDTINAYNKKRISIDLKGMQVLGTWGIANIVSGGIGSITGKYDTKYFFEMNTGWGAFNTLFAYSLYQRGINEAGEKTGYQRAYQLYRRDKSFFIYKTIADVALIGIGAGLIGAKPISDQQKQMFSGFGQSCLIQGTSMILFDDIMAIVHNRSNYNWLNIMNEISFTGYSLCYVHHF